MRRVTVDAPAKVNLRLRVLARETSGYHELESVFCAISFCDTLELTPGGDEIELVTTGIVEHLGPPDDNLAIRAARIFYIELGSVGERVRMELHKRIPAMAGLGGGSSDAAATLRGLNALYDHPFQPEDLLRMALGLGSDVPFFLCGSPLALGWSRGERLLTLPAPPSRPVLVAHPGSPMPTGAAFQRLAALRGGEYSPEAFSLSLERLANWDELAILAINDFEPVADELLPQLAVARKEMRSAGAVIALLAGSGASVFGVFPSTNARDEAEARIRALGFETWRAETIDALPAPILAGARTVDPPARAE